jgi:hypothetical protein
MSLNGMIGIGLSTPGSQNPWDAKSPPAVDFRHETTDNGISLVAMPQDHVTLNSISIPTDANPAPASSQSEENAGTATFRTIG